MSQQDVVLLESFYKAVNAGGLESLLAFAHPEFVYRTRKELPGGGTYALEGALDRMSSLRELFDEIRWEPQEFIDAGERVVVVVRQMARGRGSGASVEGQIVHVWLLRDGKVKELSVYSHRGEALEAVGLGE